jgi:hypothetical protein
VACAHATGLNLARQRLRFPGAGADLVKIVALDLGFWHFDRFAIAYRELFGETPSETLARRRCTALGAEPARPSSARITSQ